jgi:hypothetical protein
MVPATVGMTVPAAGAGARIAPATVTTTIPGS